MGRGRKKKSTSRIPKELLDEVMKHYNGPDDFVGPEGLLKELTAALVNRAMEAELSNHLGYESGETPPSDQENRRNGTSRKQIRTDQGLVDIEVPRDRNGSFEPQIVPKHSREFRGFDEKILSMYALGMSVRDIRTHLEEIYGVEVSPDLISRATESVVELRKEWQSRPLESVYFIVYLDALMVKMRGKSGVQNQAVYSAIGVRADGSKEALGLWVQETEGAKFWLTILTELRTRGVQDIFIICADGLKGMNEAVQASFPKSVFQTCIVHMIRSSTRFVPWKDRKAVCADLRQVYTADCAESAERALTAFEDKWTSKYPMVAKSWRSRWDEVTPFLSYPPEMRRMIYTTNAIEAMNRQLRKVLKTKGHFPTEESALKLLYLAVRNMEKKWGGADRRWNSAMAQFAIYFEERMPL